MSNNTLTNPSSTSLITAFKTFKHLPRVGIIAFINNAKKECCIKASRNIPLLCVSFDEEFEFDEIRILEDNVGYIYLKNFFLRYHYTQFHNAGYKIVFSERNIPKYMPSIEYKMDGRSYFLLTTIGNRRIKEILGITHDPVHAVECLKLYEEHRAPFCLWSPNTKFLCIEEVGLGYMRKYSHNLLLGVTK